MADFTEQYYARNAILSIKVTEIINLLENGDHISKIRENANEYKINNISIQK